MKVTVQVVFDDDAESTEVREVFALERGAVTPDTLGLRLGEAKDLLCAVQETVIDACLACRVRPHPTVSSMKDLFLLPVSVIHRLGMGFSARSRLRVLPKAEAAAATAVVSWNAPSSQ
jgi:hypothetical protein